MNLPGMRELHVMPEGDVFDHDADPQCVCGPIIVDFNYVSHFGGYVRYRHRMLAYVQVRKE